MADTEVVNRSDVVREISKTLEIARKRAKHDQNIDGLIHVASCWIELYDRLEHANEDRPKVGFHFEVNSTGEVKDESNES
jgi:hypothetical protein